MVKGDKSIHIQVGLWFLGSALPLKLFAGQGTRRTDGRTKQQIYASPRLGSIKCVYPSVNPKAEWLLHMEYVDYMPTRTPNEAYIHI